MLLVKQESMLPAASADVSPVIVEIVRNGIISLTEEMKINLMRTAYNMIIYEALDFTVGLYSTTGETVSIGLGLPSFVRGMSETVKAKIAHFGPDGIHPGDVLVTNDAYVTGSHLNHITLTKPIFWNGQIVAYACCMAHWVDIGGAKGDITSDIFSEGLQVPICKYISNGQVNELLVDIIRMNVRMPDLAIGDLRAQLSAVETGERRMLEMMTRYGGDSVLQSIDAIMDHSDRTARARAAEIPDGIYEAESFMDDDGISKGVPIPIRVKVIVKKGEVTIDLSGLSPQVRGYYNSAGATGIACAQVAYKCLTTPEVYPVNDGAFRNLKVICPEGTVVSAKRPAAMRWWMAIPMTVVDTIIKALAPVIPQRAAGGHHSDLAVIEFRGIDPQTGRYFVAAIGPTGGGWGAKAQEDGHPVTVASNDGDTHNSPTERIEAKYPLLVERYSLRENSGGAGQYRGGLGADIIIQALSPVEVSTPVERTRCKPWGILGAADAMANRVTLYRNSEWQELDSGKVANVLLNPGDKIRVETGGGGGFGDPRTRAHEAIEADIRNGYISLSHAMEAYGYQPG
ncbi:hydantoinase B/oxoprolinase family protein [Mesorhizobium sp. DCY119]|jgi:N-methylhydantoinase B|uniref:hydantoinase B/oxoprolinase family protein n=2 Tax=Mesorhizobium sp. DCY119 TaxID=2108445 RepID=UPI0018D533C6|nr:hydantoinase B/oxoprolinase family protein [Mesorhizobium sp. DCY119]